MSTTRARSGYRKGHANIREHTYECAEALIHRPVHMFRAHLPTTSTACMLDAREQVCAVLLEKERRRLQIADCRLQEPSLSANSEPSCVPARTVLPRWCLLGVEMVPWLPSILRQLSVSQRPLTSDSPNVHRQAATPAWHSPAFGH